MSQVPFVVLVFQKNCTLSKHYLIFIVLFIAGGLDLQFMCKLIFSKVDHDVPYSELYELKLVLLGNILAIYQSIIIKKHMLTFFRI